MSYEDRIKYYCYYYATALTKKWQNIYYNKLYPFLLDIINRVYKSTKFNSYYDFEEFNQLLLMKSLHRIKKIAIEKTVFNVKNIYNYFFRMIKNLLINELKYDNNRRKRTIYFEEQALVLLYNYDCECESNEYSYDYSYFNINRKEYYISYPISDYETEIDKE